MRSATDRDEAHGRVDVNGVELHVVELGESRADRPSVLVLHGGPDVGHSYLVPGLEPLSRDHHVITFDFRGTGRSARGLDPDRLQPELVLDDAVALLDHLGIDRVDLVGFSTGGRAATEFVRRFPRRVRRLVQASTSGYDAAAADELLAGDDELQHRQRLESEAEGRFRNAAVFVRDLSLVPAYVAMIDGLDEGDWSYERALDGRQHPWVNGEPEQILRVFGGPMLILHGRHDLGFPLGLAERLHGAVPGSRLAVIDGVAHMAQFEKPELWAAHIRSFLNADHAAVAPHLPPARPAVRA